MTKMTDLDLDTLKLEPGTPELTDAAPADVAAVMAYSQAVSLKRIADAMTANTEQHDRVEASMDAFIQREGDMLERIAVALERLTERLAAPAVTSTEPTPGADSEGWIPWHGGECPVAPLTPVTVRFRDGDGDGGPGVAKDFMWTHDDRICVTHVQIVAYKLGT